MTVLVTGGNGRLGRAVLAQLGGEGIAGVRRPGIPGSVLIDSQGHIDRAALTGITAIVNCAGRVTGTPEELEAANVTYPLALARSARDAGIARFIQVSSFSVYGRVEQIDAGTPIAPQGAYGHSKVQAEDALLALATDEFAPVVLRLPFMFSARDPALIGRLISLVRRLHIFPMRAAGRTRRSMITYAGAAEALLAAARDENIKAGILVAADATPLDLADMVGLLRDQGFGVAMLPIPHLVISAAMRVVPGIVDRLFRSSMLADDANFMRVGTAYPVAEELAVYVRGLDPTHAGQSRQS